MISPEAKQALQHTILRMRKEIEAADDQVAYFENQMSIWREKGENLQRQVDELETIVKETVNYDA